MSSFEDRILELTRSEVDRIVADFEQLRKDAASVIDQLDFYGEPIPEAILELKPKPDGPVVRPDPDHNVAQFTHYEARQVTEPAIETVEVKFEEPKQLTEKQKAYRERLDEKTRQDNERYGKMVMNVLADGPRTLTELSELIPAIETKGRMMKTLGYLQDQGRISRRKERKYQGTEYWYSLDAPVTQEQLIEFLTSVPKGQELPIAGYAKSEGFHPKYLKKMLDEQVRDGRITKRGGLYYNERSVVNPKTGRSNKRNFGGNGVATSGDKVSSSKEVNEMIRKARSLGADVKVTGGDHLQVRTEMGMVTIGKTPSASGLKQDRERLKDIGLDV